jgi:hypothetical protein
MNSLFDGGSENQGASLMILRRSSQPTQGEDKSKVVELAFRVNDPSPQAKACHGSIPTLWALSSFSHQRAGAGTIDLRRTMVGSREVAELNPLDGFASNRLGHLKLCYLIGNSL